MSRDEDEDEDYYLPLQDQRVFGAGIKRKRVPFVRAESEPAHTSQAPPKNARLGDRYLSIVLPQSRESMSHARQKLSSNTEQEEKPSNDVVCAVCNLPITSATPTAAGRPHESSLAHQVCLKHSDPPSHLDRGHVGLKYLSSYGWDPDARRGLGAAGAGIRVAIKGNVKYDTVGLGVKEVNHLRVQKETKDKIRLNAKQARKLEAEGKNRERKLREAFYGKDLEAYLGPGG